MEIKIVQINIEDIPFIWKSYVQADPDTLTADAKELAARMRKAIADCGFGSQEKHEREQQKPLTLDQLLEMDGEPVYLVFMEPLEYGWEDQWVLINVDEGIAFNNTYYIDLELCTGFAYRYPPTEV